MMNIFNLICEPSALLLSLHTSDASAARRLLTALVMSCCLLMTLIPLRTQAEPAQSNQLVKKKGHKVSSKKKTPASTVKLSFAAQQRAQNRKLLMHHPVNVVATSYSDKPSKTASSPNPHSSAAERRANRVLMAQHPDWFSYQHRKNVAPAAMGSDSIALAYRDHLQQTTQKAMSTLMKQLGKPYVWGGTSPRIGFDCSGLVYFAYHDLLTQGIPRTANGMYRRARGKMIAQSQLKRGDLIFFHIHTRQNADHVGVYLGDGKFIESPRTGEEIRISTLDDPFWQDHYLSAKRVLTLETII
jgi:cell wall-associated NlpC family hydrolase